MFIVIVAFEIFYYFDDFMFIVMIIFILPCVAVIIAAPIAIHHYNIKIEVNSTAVRFIRGNKEYQYFDRESFIFGFFTKIDAFKMPKYVVAIHKNPKEVKSRKHRVKTIKCHNFNKKTFEDLISHIRPIYFNFLNDRIRKYFFATEIQEALMENRLSTVEPYVFIVDERLRLSTMNWKIPEKVMLFSDRVEIDEKIFQFSQINQIRITTPSYYNCSFRFYRIKMIIIDDFSSNEFVIGDASRIQTSTFSINPYVFRDFNVLLYMLESIFIEEPDKIALLIG